MRAFFAVGDGATAVRMLGGRRVLVSFANLGVWITEAHVEQLEKTSPEILYDSGAFTAWNSGRTIALAEYDAFIERRHGQGRRFLALDVIGSLEQSIAQYELLRARFGEVIVPVWHEGEPLDALGAYLERAPVVAIGRTAARRQPRAVTLTLYDEVFNAFPSAKLHALGVGRPELLEPYPWDSFDATSWQRDAAYSASLGWPYSACSKETRMRAYVEATEAIRYQGAATSLTLFG